MQLREAVKAAPPLVWVLLAGLALFGLGRCTAPKPQGPSRDSLSLAHLADSLRREVALSHARDSARASHVDSTVDAVDKGRAALRHRLAPPRSTVPASSSGPDPLGTLLEANRGLQAENADLRRSLDSVLTADSVVIRSLRSDFASEQAESARLRSLLAGASDSLQTAANRIGQLERQLTDRWSLCAAGGLGSTVGVAGTPAGSGPGGAVGGTLLVGVCYRIW